MNIHTTQPVTEEMQSDLSERLDNTLDTVGNLVERRMRERATAREIIMALTACIEARGMCLNDKINVDVARRFLRETA